jgi:hypothetical protein
MELVVPLPNEPAAEAVPGASSHAQESRRRHCGRGVEVDYGTTGAV